MREGSFPEHFITMNNETKPIPVITVGRYAGTPIDQLPNSYLRWLITQDFPADWVECAQKKLEQSDHNDLFLNISRHAIDMFSKRFLSLWISAEAHKGAEGDGLATFMVKAAQEAWEKGTDISKYRHKDDGIVKLRGGIKWVFNVNPKYPDYKDVITVMDGLEQ